MSIMGLLGTWQPPCTCWSVSPLLPHPHTWPYLGFAMSHSRISSQLLRFLALWPHTGHGDCLGLSLLLRLVVTVTATVSLDEGWTACHDVHDARQGWEMDAVGDSVQPLAVFSMWRFLGPGLRVSLWSRCWQSRDLPSPGGTISRQDQGSARGILCMPEALHREGTLSFPGMDGEAGGRKESSCTPGGRECAHDS